MALQPYSKQLRTFLYELTKLERYYSDRDLSKKINVEDLGGITAKTIRRWFNYLQTFCFDFYPYIEVERLGLQYVRLVCDYRSEMLKKFPYQIYVSILTDPHTGNSQLVIDYLVPKVILDAFIKEVRTLQSKYELQKCELLPLTYPYVLHNDFGLAIDDEGNMVNGTFKDNVQTIAKFKDHLAYWESPKQGIGTKDFYMIPILFEYIKDHYTTWQVWNQISKKCQDNIWLLLPKIKKRTSSAGIKRVQTGLNEIVKLGLIKQMKVTYKPFEKNKMYIWFKINAQLPEFIQLCTKLLPKCVTIKIYKINPDEFFCIILTSTDGYIALLNVSKSISGCAISDVMLENIKETDTFWSRDLVKFKYSELIDYKNKSWDPTLKSYTENQNKEKK